jgi:hypothetical protein
MTTTNYHLFIMKAFGAHVFNIPCEKSTLTKFEVAYKNFETFKAKRIHIITTMKRGFQKNLPKDNLHPLEAFVTTTSRCYVLLVNTSEHKSIKEWIGKLTSTRLYIRQTL